MLFYPEDATIRFMREALRMAEYAFESGEVPVGAVVVSDGRIIGKGYNQVETLCDPTAHAEMIALTAACNHLGSKYLEECSLYVTLEPCLMCTGAMRWGRLKEVFYGAREEKFGYLTLSPNGFHPKTIIHGGILAEECAELMRSFFKTKRD